MNRPNFRVWDKEEQKWYKPTYKAYMNELHDIHIDLDGGLLIRTIDESGKRVTIHESMFEGRYELLQSTGLKDINGKDIYEGDVLKYRDEYRVVEMYDGAWITRIGEKRLIVKMAVLSGAEVIGNKFEHPHLLGEE